MAHFIVATIGTYGDVYPFAQVAIALKKMGHQTTFITNPYFEQTVKQFGLDFYPLGQLLDLVARFPHQNAHS